MLEILTYSVKTRLIMTIRNILIAVCIMTLSSYNLYSQKEANNWLFGERAGITFNTADGKPVCISDGALSTLEGTASISDKNGNLLFYTDGDRVWNRNNDRMPNGKGLMGDVSSTQSAIIVKKPGSENIYYIFTIAAQAGKNGFRYSMADMSMDGGRGDLFKKNIPLFDSTSEKVVAVRHSNGEDIWVIVHEWGSDSFRAYLIDKDSISTVPVISHSGSVHTGGYANGDAIGYMKTSTDGKKLALAMQSRRLFELFDFDNSTGLVSNPISISYPLSNFGFYGIEFSTDGRYLFVPMIMDSTNPVTGIYRYDLNSADIKNSAVLIGQSSGDKDIYELQLGPDGNIYAAINQRNYLGVIYNPQKELPLCKFVEDGVDLCGKMCYLGLPNILSEYLSNGKCGNDAFSYQNMTDLNNFKLVGSAKPGDSVIKLTEINPNTSGAIWRKGMVQIRAGFTTDFSIRLSDGFNDFQDGSLPGADGFAFVIQSNHQEALGSSGGGIGFQGIPNCIAVEFDTYNNEFDLHDPNGNHIAAFAGKESIINDHTSSDFLGENINTLKMKADSSVYHVRILYNQQPNVLEVFIDTSDSFGAPSLRIENFNIDSLISIRSDGKAYIGITSATGNSFERHELLSWEFCPDRLENVVSVEDDNNISDDKNIEISPNPFDYQLNISLSLYNYSYINIQLFDIYGNNITNLINSYKESGNYNLNYDVSFIKPGIYCIKSYINNDIIINKLIKY
ncbi:MAG: hypothetical protein QG635_761 [Bacteroidota bacterium]|nr:hypothetical protein [Bacteroidota bacterium]